MVENVQFHITAALVPQKALLAPFERGGGWPSAVSGSFGHIKDPLPLPKNGSTMEVTVPIICP